MGEWGSEESPLIHNPPIRNHRSRAAHAPLLRPTSHDARLARRLMLLMGEGRPMLLEMLGLLEEKLAALTAQIAGLPGDVLLAPDNLDGQYISPRVFREQMAESYRRTADAAHAQDKRLVVHAGGPVRRLLPLLAAAGVDVVEGVAPPPQSDATLAEARAAAGPDLILWGGIPQDLLLARTRRNRVRGGGEGRSHSSGARRPDDRRHRRPRAGQRRYRALASHVAPARRGGQLIPIDWQSSGDQRWTTIVGRRLSSITPCRLNFRPFFPRFLPL